MWLISVPGFHFIIFLKHFSFVYSIYVGSLSIFKYIYRYDFIRMNNFSRNRNSNCFLLTSFTPSHTLCRLWIAYLSNWFKCVCVMEEMKNINKFGQYCKRSSVDTYATVLSLQIYSYHPVCSGGKRNFKCHHFLCFVFLNVWEWLMLAQMLEKS